MHNQSEKWTGSTESIEYRPGAGVFIALLLIAAIGFVVAGFFLWYIPTVGLGSIHPSLPYITAGLFIGAALFVLAGIAVITLAAARGSLIFYAPWLRWFLVKIFLPVMIMAGGVMRIPKIRIERIFIDLNNQMVKHMRKKGFAPKRLLMLMPHCIQFDNCKIKVTRNVKNCAGCGRCEIGRLLDIGNEFGIDLFISTGGTVARRKVMQDRPDAVIAVACERDLTSGLQDSYPLPVIAIVNKRPMGYCMETGVDLTEIRQAVMDLAGC